MRRSEINVIFFVIVLILSVFVTDVINVIDVNSSIENGKPLKNGPDDGMKPAWKKPKKYDIGNSADNLMWYLQISDLHISVFTDPTRLSEFKEFCNVTVGAFKPHVVIGTGDLTDSKTEDGLGSGVVESEWVHYKKVLDETEVTKKTIWLDVRGNHDNFNIISSNSTNNYFNKYSVQGKQHPRSYMRQINIGGEKYTFMAIDACLKPGPRRPFNFIGAIDANEIEEIRRLVVQSRKNESDYILWFGHYPTSCILADCKGGVRSLMGKYEESIVYMCGHYHTLSGLAPHMYALHDDGYLELELADWKDNRAYRLGVMDHGQFSFTDVKHREWPVVLVTNPKHAQYAMPQKENSQSIVGSTHVRILAFSLVSIKSVEIKIDDGSWEDCVNIKGPLYAAKWNPSIYTSGIHNIRARVVDNDGREKEIMQPFILDGTQMSFGFFPRFLLMSEATTVFQVLFGSILTIVVAPLCILRFLHILCEKNRMKRPKLRTPVFGWWTRKLWILSTVDSLFFPLVCYALYFTFGPWSVGEVMDNHTGVIFAWGMFVNGSFLPGGFTWLWGFFQLFSFHFPLTLILAHQADLRLRAFENPQSKSPKVWRLIWRHLPFLLLISMQCAMIYIYFREYGTMNALLCPLRTWSLILAIFLWYRAHTMPQECLRPAARIFSASERLANRDVDITESTQM